MEVHHHPDLHHKPKKWKEYFLEFLMIFLAVTMGFFAEQVREYYADKGKIKEYMQEIVQSLKYDTVRCNINAQENIEIHTGLDSLKAELKNAIDGKINSNALYYYTLKYSTNFGQVVFNTSAINELKNSGSLRLVENKNLLGEIYDYYERKIFATNYYMPSTNHLDELKKAQNNFFSLINLDDYVQAFNNITDKTYDANYNYKNILEHVPSLQLLTTNSLDLQRFYTQISDHQIEISRYNFWILYCQKAANKLIKDIQGEYHLKDE